MNASLPYAYLSIQVEHEYLVMGESEHSALLNVLK